MTDTERLQRALLSLEGLSVGDAFGERFFTHRTALARIWLSATPNTELHQLSLGNPPWYWTDDTAMALAIVAVLRNWGEIDPDRLAEEFSHNYSAEPRRGYGPAMHRLLPLLRQRRAWQTAPRDLFSGQGSFGNGSAMRVAPLGAYFADDLGKVVEQAHQSAVITHTHPEGSAGAIAVAVATALAWQTRGQAKPTPQEFMDQVLIHTPPSEVASGIRRARDLSPQTTIQTAAQILGNGHDVTAQDTVPFVLWSAANQLDNYESALWSTVAGLGDMDTTCAMVGGIVVMRTGFDSIPTVWRQNREVLPAGFDPGHLDLPPI